MALTISMRQAFVDAVLADVPVVDYPSMIRDIALADAVAQLPEAVRRMYDDPALRGFVAHKFIRPNDYFVEVHIPVGSDRFCLSRRATAEITQLIGKNEAQDQRLRSLRASLAAAILRCRTRQDVEAYLPDFIHYLPADPGQAPASTTPAAHILVLLREAGWQPRSIGA